MPCSLCKQNGHNSRTCPSKKTVESKSESNPQPIVIEQENKIIPKSKAKQYFCYFLGQQDSINGRGPTYNGYTVNLNRRLRQHNGEIKGGAFATSKMGRGPWHFIAVLTCNSWTSVRAMQVEWLCRYPTRKKPRPQCFSGPSGRIQSLIEVSKRLEKDEIIKMFVHPDYFNMAQQLKLPESITLAKTVEEILI